MSFDPAEASAEQREAMRWAFNKASEACRATQATEISSRELGLETWPPEDTAARLASVCTMLAHKHGPKEEEEGKDAATNA
jgi:hypothetical protein